MSLFTALDLAGRSVASTPPQANSLRRTSSTSSLEDLVKTSGFRRLAEEAEVKPVHLKAGMQVGISILQALSTDASEADIPRILNLALFNLERGSQNCATPESQKVAKVLELLNQKAPDGELAVPKGSQKIFLQGLLQGFKSEDE